MVEAAVFFRELLKDKIGLIIIRLILLTLLVCLIISAFLAYKDGPNGKPVNFLWGFYKREKIDTIRIIQHDTIYQTLPSKIEYKAPSKTVTSNNQTGGQTGFEINNK